MDNATYLSLSAENALVGELNEIYASNAQVLDIIANWSTILVNPPESSITLASDAISAESVVGMYTGSVTLPYTKKSLNNLLPYPLVFSWSYPTTFAQVQTFLMETYDIYLEEGEFEVANNVSVSGVLSSTDAIDAVPNGTTGYVTFVAQSSSGRFVEGSSFNLVCTQAQFPLATILALTTSPNLDILTDH
jgi:hypothetical protein